MKWLLIITLGTSHGYQVAPSKAACEKLAASYQRDGATTRCEEVPATTTRNLR